MVLIGFPSSSSSVMIVFIRRIIWFILGIMHERGRLIRRRIAIIMKEKEKRGEIIEILPYIAKKQSKR